MKKLALGLMAAASILTAAPAMAQVGFYVGPGGFGVGVGPGYYGDCGYYGCGRGYYDYYDGPSYGYGPGWGYRHYRHFHHHW